MWWTKRITQIPTRLGSAAILVVATLSECDKAVAVKANDIDTGRRDHLPSPGSSVRPIGELQAIPSGTKAPSVGVRSGPKRSKPVEFGTLLANRPNRVVPIELQTAQKSASSRGDRLPSATCPRNRWRYCSAQLGHLHRSDCSQTALSSRFGTTVTGVARAYGSATEVVQAMAEGPIPPEVV
jgi:hypothetical protein